MKNIKKIIIVLLIVVIILSGIIIFFMNYDIKIISDASIEYKNLLNLAKYDYYHENHLVVVENDTYFYDVYSNSVDNKTIQPSFLYSFSDEGKCVKAMGCIDNNNNLSYVWYSYKDSQYVKYNNNSLDTYTLYNFEKSINAFDTDTVPNLELFLNYTPQFQAKYQNSNESEDNKYIEVYKLYFKDDDFYNNHLSKFVENNKNAYLRVVINNMNLITSIGLTLEPTSKYVFGPFTYNYYYDKQYDLSHFYEYADMKKNDLITVIFKNVADDKEIDRINIDKKETLFVEKGKKIDGIYLDKNCIMNYQDFMNKKALDSKVSNILNNDSILYVKYK